MSLLQPTKERMIFDPMKNKHKQVKQTEFDFVKEVKRKKPRSHNSEKKRMLESIRDEETNDQLEFKYSYEL